VDFVLQTLALKTAFLVRPSQYPMNPLPDTPQPKKLALYSRRNLVKS
jgi:hypothetical protein